MIEERIACYLFVVAFLIGALMQYCFERLVIAWLMKKEKYNGVFEERPAVAETADDEEK